MIPHSIDAEQAVLGALLVANDTLTKVGDWLSADDFHHGYHREVYAAIQALAEAGQPFDAITVGQHLEANASEVPSSYVVELATGVLTVSSVTAYAEIVVDKARMRRLMELGESLIAQASKPEGKNAQQIATEATSSLLTLSAGTALRGAKSMKEVGGRWFDQMQERHARGGALNGLGTPWSRLNGVTSGLNAGELVILAARPSMGKSAAAVNLATSAALRGKRVMFFNLEMTDVSIFNRAIASIQGIPLAWLKTGGVTENGETDYWAEVTAGVRLLGDAPLRIDDEPGLSAQQIVARCRREHLQAPLDLVIIDHLHILSLPGKANATQEINHATTAFKGLAKRLKCPVVLLSQLNRNLESRANKRPAMADLRESGGIEQDADLILFLYRDDYYAKQENRVSEYPNWVEMIVAKNREGVSGETIWLRDQLAFGLLDDYDGQPPAKNVVPVDKSQRPAMLSRYKAAENF